MRKLFIITAVCSIAMTSAFAQVKKTTTVKKAVAKAVVAVKKTTLDSASYGFGMSMGESIKSAGLTSLNYDLLLKGVKESFSGVKGMITQQEAQKAIQAVIAKANSQKFAVNIAEGKAFLEKNKSVAGIKSTPSGIQYLVLTQGTGSKPAATDSVTVHYQGKLLNGFEFDSSYKRNEPTTFPLNEVIPGWTEAVQLMNVGSKYRFFIPSELAYGDRGAGADIPPYSTLIFEIELIKIAAVKKI